MALLGCGDWGEAGWKRQTVERVLKIGFDDDAMASTERFGMQVTLLVYVASKAMKRTVISTSIFTTESDPGAVG